MTKYGLRSLTTEESPSVVDPDILLFISDAAQQYYSGIIRELISVSRAQHFTTFINKKILPRDTLEVQTFNCKQSLEHIAPHDPYFGMQGSFYPYFNPMMH